MDRGARKTHVVQKVIQEIGLGLRVDKNQGTRWRHCQQKVVEALLFKVVLRVDDLYLFSNTSISEWALDYSRSDRRLCGCCQDVQCGYEHGLPQGICGPNYGIRG